MNETQEERLDKMSNLREQLRNLDTKQLGGDGGELRQAREGVVEARKAYWHSRYQLGRALRAYKTHFKAERNGWATGKVIAAAIDRVERTVSGSGPRFLGRASQNQRSQSGL